MRQWKVALIQLANRPPISSTYSDWKFQHISVQPGLDGELMMWLTDERKIFRSWTLIFVQVLKYQLVRGDLRLLSSYWFQMLPSVSRVPAFAGWLYIFVGYFWPLFLWFRDLLAKKAKNLLVSPNEMLKCWCWLCTLCKRKGKKKSNYIKKYQFRFVPPL